ncbi:MAG: Ig-like domain-containing protein [Gemmatimonadetes bacterium]|nr:Ig-like domain-containing protein [Gemmatimonadota bacterium]
MPSKHRLAAIATVVAVTWSCGDGTTTPPAPQPTTLELSQTIVALDAIGATQQLSATVKDQNGQTMSGQTVTWSSAAAGVATVNSSGLVTAVGNGQADVTASSGSLSATVAVTVAQVATQLAKVAGGAQTGVVGTQLAVALEVELRDRLGNAVLGGAGGAVASTAVASTAVASTAVASTAVNFTVSQGGGSVADTSVSVGANGRASTTWTLGTAAGAAHEATASLTGGSISTTFNATATAGPPTAALKASGDAQSGTVATPLAAPLVVHVEDQFTNPVPDEVVTFAVTQGGGSVDSASVMTDANGDAPVNWTLGNVPGANEVTFTVASLPAGTFTATGQLGPPANVVVTAGDAQSATVNTAVATLPSVQVTDVGGNPLSGESVTFAPTAGGGSVTGGTTTTDGSGNATVGSWTLGTTAGANELTATATSASTTISATGLPGPAASLAVDAGDGQSGVVGSVVPIPPSVLVTDEFGNTVQGESVGFAVTSGGGSVTGTPATSDASGIAAVGSWTLGGTPGSNTLDATSGALTPLTFTATGVAATPDMVAVNDGDNQTGLVGSPVNIPPSVLVTAGGLPFPGATVTFSVTGGGGSSMTNVAVTGADGIAQVGEWTLGAAAGSNTLSATVTGAGITGNPVTLTATGQDAAFNIEVRFLSAPTAAQQTAFDNAETKWENLLFGDLADQAVNIAADACGMNTNPAVNETIDDLVIFVRLEAIDGVGGVLGSAGPCIIRSGTGGLPAYGIMRFDTDDLPNIEAAGQLEDVILHEMGHVLGFGTLWPTFGFLQNPSWPSSPGVDTHFDGPRAIAEFDAIGGTNYTGGAKVPVENTQGGEGTRDGHWRESVFDAELLTGFIEASGSMPLSSLSVAAMWDLGYLVNLSGAEPYSETFTLRAGPPLASELRDEIWRGPIYVVDTRGRVISVIGR